MKNANDGIELRIVVPRDQLPGQPAPDFYSQLNCELLGLNRRGFLELLRREGAPPVTKLGKLRLVKRTAMLEYMDRLRELEDAAGPPLDGADEVLREIGYAPRPSRRKAG